MSKSKEREEALNVLASRIFTAMLDDIVMDTVLKSHYEVARSRTVCRACNTQCGIDHAPSTSAPVQTLPPVVVPSRPSTPAGELRATNGSSGTGASTPSSVKAEGNIYFECLSCQRQIASTRYAPHLSSCMGIGTGTRRGAVRTANSVRRMSPTGRSASPSDAGDLSDESVAGKGKGKSKSKRADEAEFNLKRKRPTSPQLSPNKKTKQQKASSSAVRRVRSEADAMGVVNNTPPSLVPPNSQSRVPSRLRESSTASFPASPSPRSNSLSSSESPVGTPSSSSGTAITAVSAPVAPAPVQAAPTPKPKGRPKKKTNVNGTAAPPPAATPVRQPSPPRPSPPPARVIEPTYLDVDGHETGSSTDTDND